MRRHRQDAQEVKSITAAAVSNLAQFQTTFSELISAVAALSGSDDPVDRLHIAKLAKLQAERTELYAKVLTVKNGIDQLGL